MRREDNKDIKIKTRKGTSDKVRETIPHPKKPQRQPPSTDEGLNEYYEDLNEYLKKANYRCDSDSGTAMEWEESHWEGYPSQ